MELNSKIYIAGHNGMVGSSIQRLLLSLGYSNIVTRTSNELDLRNQSAVNEFFVQEKPEYVFLAAAKVGGILANTTYPAEFLYDNIMIQSNVIYSSLNSGVKKLINFNSSLVYSSSGTEPKKEGDISLNAINESHSGYAFAKLYGIFLANLINKQYRTRYINIICSNIYGPNDKFDSNHSNVVASLIYKIYFAKKNKIKNLELFGDGSQVRDFIFVDDLSSAAYLVMIENHNFSEINVSTSVGTTILNLSKSIQKIIQFDGTINFGLNQHSGRQYMVLDNNLLKEFNWEPRVQLMEGLKITYDWFVNHLENI